MACPKVVLCGKTVFLLSGYDKVKAAREKDERKLPDIIAMKELKQSASRHPDAVAFGYGERREIVLRKCLKLSRGGVDQRGDRSVRLRSSAVSLVLHEALV